MKALPLAVAVVVAMFCCCSFTTAQCPIPDPNTLPPGDINITISDRNVEIIRIDIGSTHDGVTYEGHSEMVTDVKFNPLTQLFTFDVWIPRIAIVSEAGTAGYKATGQITSAPFRPETIPNGPFSGNGEFAASATDVRFAGNATIIVNLLVNRVFCRSININTFTFENVNVNLANFISNGETINWDTWNAEFKANFDHDWAAGRAEIQERIKAPIDVWLKDKPLSDLLDILLPRPPTPCITTPATNL